MHHICVYLIKPHSFIHSPYIFIFQEYVDGQLKNKYGDVFIRGNNVSYISTIKQ